MKNLFLELVGAEGCYDFNPKLFIRWLALTLKTIPALMAVAIKYDFEDEALSLLQINITQDVLDKINDKMTDEAVANLKKEFDSGCQIRFCAGLPKKLSLKDALMSKMNMAGQISEVRTFKDAMERAVMQSLSIDLDCAPQERAFKEASDYLAILEIIYDDEPIMFEGEAEVAV